MTHWPNDHVERAKRAESLFRPSSQLFRDLRELLVTDKISFVTAMPTHWQPKSWRTEAEAHRERVEKALKDTLESRPDTAIHVAEIQATAEKYKADAVKDAEILKGQNRADTPLLPSLSRASSAYSPAFLLARSRSRRQTRRRRHRRVQLAW